MASMEAIFNDNFNCYKCTKKYPLEIKRKKDEPAKPNQRGIVKRKSMGCFDFTTRTFLLDNVKYSSCIGNYTLQGLGYYFEAFLAYEKGMLPFEGDLGMQPNKMVEVLHIIDTIKKDKNKEG